MKENDMKENDMKENGRKSKCRIINGYFRLLCSVLLVICLLLSLPGLSYAAEEDILEEVRALINDYYVDPVSEQVLQASSVEEMLERLGDQNTRYMTKEEYDEFMSVLERSFSGVGIEFTIVDQGAKVMKAMAGYGAEKAGIKQGDIIVEADGFSLAGQSSEYVFSKLQGPEGSKVRVKVLRGTETVSFDIERMNIELPLVEGDILDGHIGYVVVYSFGESTAAQFDQQVRELKMQGADSWIIDLRDNGGGYTQAALDLLGYFIGDKTALIVKDKSSPAIAYRAMEKEYMLDGTIVLLTNQYTASASEITAAAIKDHYKATIIGENTYGSGRVKALIRLSNGDYLKMSISKFLSPYNLPIDKVGVSPHLELEGLNELWTAGFLLKNVGLNNPNTQSGDKTGYILLEAGPNDFPISVADLRKAEYWTLGQKLLDSAYETVTLKLGGSEGWDTFPEEYLEERYKIYYPEYSQICELRDIPVDKKFTVTFNMSMDWQSVTDESIELIELDSGQRITCQYEFVDDKVMVVQPVTELKKAKDYWLVVHSNIAGKNGKNISGGVVLAKTAM